MCQSQCYALLHRSSLHRSSPPRLRSVGAMIRRDKEAGQGRSTGTGQAAREYKQEGPRIKVLVHLTYVCRMRRAERSCPSQPANQAGDSQTTPFPYSCLLPPLHLALFLSRQHRRRGGEMESSEQGARAGGASARHGETTHSRADEVRGEGRGQKREIAST